MDLEQSRQEACKWSTVMTAVSPPKGGCDGTVKETAVVSASSRASTETSASRSAAEVYSSLRRRAMARTRS
jgi:hypothetical protein